MSKCRRPAQRQPPFLADGPREVALGCAPRSDCMESSRNRFAAGTRREQPNAASAAFAEAMTARCELASCERRCAGDAGTVDWNTPCFTDMVALRRLPAGAGHG